MVMRTKKEKKWADEMVSDLRGILEELESRVSQLGATGIWDQVILCCGALSSALKHV